VKNNVNFEIYQKPLASAFTLMFTRGVTYAFFNYF